MKDNEQGWSWLRLGDRYRESQQIPEARDCYSKACNFESTAQWGMLSLGELYREQKDYNQAREYYHKAQQINQNFICAIAALADILRYEQSIEHPYLHDDYSFLNQY